MRTRPADIAKALLEQVERDPASADAACQSSLLLLKRTAPGFPRRQFVKLVEREMRRRGEEASGLLIVPRLHVLKREQLGTLVTKTTGKPVRMDKKIDPDIIGGAVLLIDHHRIDASVQGALRELLRVCLQPLE